MLKEQFDVAAEATRIRKPLLLDAARAVMVDGMSVGEVAEKFNLRPSHLYKAIASVEQKWSDICTARNLKYLPIALPERMMRIVLEIQSQEIDDYRKSLRARRRSKE